MHWSPFISGFFTPELKTFLRKKWVLLLSLLLMILSLWTIGFNNGSRDLLKDRMESPFIKFLSIDITPKIDSDSLKYSLGRDTVKSRFGICGQEFVHIGRREFLSRDGKSKLSTYRMIEQVDEEGNSCEGSGSMYDYIFGDPNLFLFAKAGLQMDSASWSVVVSRDFLKNMGYDPYDPPNAISCVIREDGKESGMPLPIVAVAHKLPNKSDMLVGVRAYRSLQEAYKRNPFLRDGNKGIWARNASIFIETDQNMDQVREKLRTCGVQLDGESLVEDNTHFKPGLQFHETMSFPEDLKEIENALTQCLSSDPNFTLNKEFWYDQVRLGELEEKVLPSMLLIEMSTLDSVAELSDYLAKEFEIEVDMSEIESTKNFNIFNKISSILSVTLSILTIILVIYILSRSIIEHINKNSANLGTLKAFGLANSSIVAVYSGIAAVIVLSIYICSFAVAAGLGALVNQVIMGEQIVAGINSAELFSLPFAGIYFLEFVAVPVLIIATLVFSKLHGKTPGDLVYGR